MSRSDGSGKAGPFKRGEQGNCTGCKWFKEGHPDESTDISMSFVCAYEKFLIPIVGERCIMQVGDGNAYKYAFEPISVFKPTNKLRWHKIVKMQSYGESSKITLQQYWEDDSGNKGEWRDVPTETEK